MLPKLKHIKAYSSTAQIANIIFKAPTERKSKLRYVARADAKAIYNQRK